MKHLDFNDALQHLLQILQPLFGGFYVVRGRFGGERKSRGAKDDLKTYFKQLTTLVPVKKHTRHIFDTLQCMTAKYE